MDTHTHTNINNGRKAASQVTVKYDRWVCGVSISTPPSEHPLPSVTFDLSEHTLSSPPLLQCLNTEVRNPVSTHSRQPPNSVCICVCQGSDKLHMTTASTASHLWSLLLFISISLLLADTNKALCIQLHAQLHTLLLNLSILQNTIIIASQAGCICEVLKTSLSTSLKWYFNIHFLKLFLMPFAVPFLTRAYKDVSSTLATFIPHEMEN